LVNTGNRVKQPERSHAASRAGITRALSTPTTIRMHRRRSLVPSGCLLAIFFGKQTQIYVNFNYFKIERQIWQLKYGQEQVDIKDIIGFFFTKRRKSISIQYSR
jgi:hypothetical protein